MASPRTRRILGATALAVGVIGAFVAAALGSRKLFERQPVREEKPAKALRSLLGDVPAEDGRFRVSAVQGPVECEHDGRLYLVQAGDLLVLADVLRTPPGARALLRRGQTEIELRENVEIRLDRLATETASFGVISGGGNVVATVEGARETVEITAAETRAVNEGPSRWVVALDQKGRVNVAVSKGAVRFAGRGRAVRVPSGSESTAPPQAPPSDPVRLPEELLLSVIWPEVPAGAPRAQLKGKVSSPSTRVRVNGATIDVGEDGSFAAAVPVGVGTNPVEVDAEDVLGRRKSERGVLRRPAPVPVLEAKPEELWQQ